MWGGKLVLMVGVLVLFVATCDAQHNHDVVDGLRGDEGSSVGGLDPASLLQLRRTVRQIISETTPLKPANASGTRTRDVYDYTRSFHVGTSCHDLQGSQGASKSGVYLIHPPNLVQGPWKVFCDMESEGGGWTVFQVRDDVEPHENFMRGWEDYKVGFGDFDREFWLGNILLWALTNVDNQTQYELHIELEDWSGNKRFARYRGFRVGSERDAYRLYHANVYFGNAGDSLFSHNGLPFSTFDVDNDNRDGDFVERSCARLYKGAWWYGNCHDANLNGWYLGGPHRSFADGVNWYTWTGYNYSLRRTIMKFRPQSSGPIPVGFDTFIIANRKRSLAQEHNTYRQQKQLKLDGLDEARAEERYEEVAWMYPSYSPPATPSPDPPTPTSTCNNFINTYPRINLPTSVTTSFQLYHINL